MLYLPRTEKPDIGIPLDFSNDLTDALAVYYALNENAGGTPFDLSGNRNHGTWNGTGVHWAGGAAQFNLSDDYIDGGSDEILEFASGDDMSLLALVNPTTVAGGDNYSIMNRINSANSDHRNYCLRIDGTGVLDFHYRNSTSTGWHIWTSSAAVVVANKLQHVAITYTMATGSSLKAYVDGIPVAGSWTTGSGDIAPYTSGTQNFITGIIVSGSFEEFGGLMDQVSVYRRILSAAEITELASNPWILHEPILLPFEAAVGVLMPYYYRTLLQGDRL